MKMVVNLILGLIIMERPVGPKFGPPNFFLEPVLDIVPNYHPMQFKGKHLARLTQI